MASKDATQTVAVLLDSSQKDAKLVKIMSIVAVIYLPVSLIAVSIHSLYLVRCFINSVRITYILHHGSSPSSAAT